MVGHLHLKRTGPFVKNTRVPALAFGFGAALVLTTFAFLYLNLESIEADAGASEFFLSCAERLALGRNLALVGIGLAAGTAAASTVFLHRKRCLELLYAFRWPIAIGAIAIGTCLGISGSSLGMWYDEGGWDGTLFGTARSCRSDEFLVNTPMAFAQGFNDSGAWPYFGETFRGATSDMFIVYGQPVADPAVIFRPFHWGYLLLGTERGLAFFWCARVVMLLMCTFEVGMLVARQRRGLACGLALLVTFAPVISWWLDVNGYVEMIVSCEIMLLIIAGYLKTTSYRVRIALGLPFVICGGCFVLTFYPALQVPIAYLFFTMAAVYIALHWREARLSRKDALIVGGFFLLFCVGMAYVFGKSWDTVQAVLNTAYPGHRADCGRGALPLLAQYPLDALTPLRSFADSLRIDAFASVYDFFPLGILVSLWVVLKEGRRDAYLIALLALNAFLGWYCFAGFPEPLAKLTLMSLSTGRLYSKAFIVFGLINLLLLIRGLALLKARPTRAAATAVAIVAGGAIMAGSAAAFPWFYNTAAFAACALVLIGGMYLLLRRADGADGALAAYLATLALFMGVMVNPVQIGAGPILENETREAVAAINQERPDSVWAVTGDDSSAYADLAATSGAAVINTCNVYPNLSLWRAFDPAGSYDDVYNRYAHISIEVVHGETHFGDAAFDSFTLYVNPSDIPLLGADYLVSTQELGAFSTNEVSFASLGEAVNGRTIYEVHLQDRRSTG
mgnify:FL=1